VERKYGHLVVSTNKLENGLVRINVDFKGRSVWAVCQPQDEIETIQQLVIELMEDEITTIGLFLKNFPQKETEEEK
jgi:hypothetical protein